MDFEAAKEAYEAADDTWIARPPWWRNDPGKRAEYHPRMATLAAACRDAATTEQDRCRWDIRWHAHFVNSGRVAPVAAPKPVKARPEQLSMF